jgi:hypothetical protein
VNPFLQSFVLGACGGSVAASVVLFRPAAQRRRRRRWEAFVCILGAQRAQARKDELAVAVLLDAALCLLEDRDPEIPYEELQQTLGMRRARQNVGQS